MKTNDKSHSIKKREKFHKKKEKKTSATPMGLEPMTFGFASQCHNHYANESLH